jgi:hypothetical protein
MPVLYVIVICRFERLRCVYGVPRRQTHLLTRQVREVRDQSDQRLVGVHWLVARPKLSDTYQVPASDVLCSLFWLLLARI